MPFICAFFCAVLTLFQAAQATSATLALGLGNQGSGYVDVVETTSFHNRSWPRVDWATYNNAQGETRPVWCDIDGDGKHELVVGLGEGGAGWLRIFDDTDTGHAALAWVHVPWESYNASNGETFPACGDLDNDGRDEIALGLGYGSHGWVPILDDAQAGYGVIQWLQLAWPDYNAAHGAVHPVAGNLDDDAADELVFGLGSGSGGYLEAMDDAAHGFAHLTWLKGHWSTYNITNGETRPALCDVDQDGRNELVLGLGTGGYGYLEVLDDMARGFGNLAWPAVSWPSYNTINGETFPACGDLDGDAHPEFIIGLGEGSAGYYERLDDQATNFVSLGWQTGHWPSYNRTSGLIRPALSVAVATRHTANTEAIGTITEDDDAAENGAAASSDEIDAIIASDDGYAYMNVLRASAGLNTYRINGQLEESADNHAYYLVVNGLRQHHETPGDTGFTGERPAHRAQATGYQAFGTISEVIAYDSTQIASIDGLMSAIYHRFGLMRNNVDEIGFGFRQQGDDNAFVGNNSNSKLADLCDGESFDGYGTYYRMCDPEIRVEESVYTAAANAVRRQNPALVVWPPDQATNILPVFYEESPDPLPDYSVSGYPISAEFNTTKIDHVELLSFELYNQDDEQQVTHTRLMDQNSDPNGKFDSHQFALFPLDRLAYNTTYRAEITYLQDGVHQEKSWSFTTRNLGHPVYTIEANGEQLTVESGSTFYIYIPPTQEAVSMGGYSLNRSGSASIDATFMDGNTLQITFTGSTGQYAHFTLGNGGLFSLIIQ